MSETRNSNLWGKITVIIVICCCCLSAQAKYGGGTGEPNDPYLIADANHMNAIGADPCDWDKYFILMADIDMSAYTGTQYNIIGIYPKVFNGGFDGNGHVIRNFTYISGGNGPGGLFGDVGIWLDDSNGVIKDLTLENVYIDVENGDAVGGLAGSSYGTILNCHVTGYVSGKDFVGGLTGVNEFNVINSSANVEVSGTWFVGGLTGIVGEDTFDVSGCWSAGSVTGQTYVGGFAGCNYEANIRNSYSNANVSGIDSVGGLVGFNEVDSSVIDCYATGVVTGYHDVGGVVGKNAWDDEEGRGVVLRCYATGNVVGDIHVGGLVGHNNKGTVSASFWDIETGGPDNGIGTPLLTAQMQIRSPFTNAGWDFVGKTIHGSEYIWRLCVDGTSYPQLNWQFQLGDFLCPDRVDFIDYSFFASHWAEDNCDASNDCDRTDLDLLGSVDIKDLRIFVGNWLWLAGRPPGQAGNPNPADGAVIPGIDVEWPASNFFIYTSLDFVPGTTADPDPNVRRAYFSKNRDDVVNRVQDANLGPPPFMDPCCYPLDPDSYFVGMPASVYEMVPYAFVPETGLESLERGDVYYWCVDETDVDGHTFPGDIWEFTIHGFYAFSPSPPNDAILVDPNVVLSWGEGYGVQEHDIYLGTSWDDVNNADANDNTGIYRGLRMAPNYPCSNLELTTKFYWRVDEVQGRSPPLLPGIIYKGDVWSFTTRSSWPP